MSQRIQCQCGNQDTDEMTIFYKAPDGKHPHVSRRAGDERWMRCWHCNAEFRPAVTRTITLTTIVNHTAEQDLSGMTDEAITATILKRVKPMTLELQFRVEAALAALMDGKPSEKAH